MALEKRKEAERKAEDDLKKKQQDQEAARLRRLKEEQEAKKKAEDDAIRALKQEELLEKALQGAEEKKRKEQEEEKLRKLSEKYGGKDKLTAIQASVAELRKSQADSPDTVLHAAVLRQDEALVQYLLEEDKVDSNRVNPNNEIPLHVAVGLASERTVDMLIKAGSNVNTINRDGNTPLHIASREVGPFLFTHLLTHTNPHTFLHAKKQPNFPHPHPSILIVPIYSVSKWYRNAYLDSLPPHRAKRRTAGDS